MRSSAIVITALLGVLFPDAAEAAKVMYCDEHGYAWVLETNSQGMTEVTPAGGCAFGPWRIDLAAAIRPGRLGGVESDWRHDRYLGSAVAVLQHFPAGDVRWKDASRDFKARAGAARARGTLRIDSRRLPAHVVRFLATEPPAGKGHRRAR